MGKGMVKPVVPGKKEVQKLPPEKTKAVEKGKAPLGLPVGASNNSRNREDHG